MKILAPVCILLVLSCSIAGQVFHYDVPAQVLLHALNNFSVPLSHNTTLNTTEFVKNTRWNNTSLNTTGSPTWNYTNGNADLIVGTISPLDRRLFKQVFTKQGRWYSGREKIVEYPKDLPGSYGRHEIISAVRAYNQFYDGLDCKAEILAGGVGNRYVKIKLSSPRQRGFKYSVQIYGR